MQRRRSRQVGTDGEQWKSRSGGEQICLWFVWDLRANFWLMRREDASLGCLLLTRHLSDNPHFFNPFPFFSSDVYFMSFEALTLSWPHLYLKLSVASLFWSLYWTGLKQMKSLQTSINFILVYSLLVLQYNTKNSSGLRRLIWANKTTTTIVSPGYLCVARCPYFSAEQTELCLFLLHVWANAVQWAEEVTIETSHWKHWTWISVLPMHV